jgi:hypothetical protein
VEAGDGQFLIEPALKLWHVGDEKSRAVEIGAPVEGLCGGNQLGFRYLDKLTSSACEAQNKTKAKVTGIRMRHRVTVNLRCPSFLPKAVAKPREGKPVCGAVFIAANDRRE